jgi:phospholipase C
MIHKIALKSLMLFLLAIIFSSTLIISFRNDYFVSYTLTKTPIKHFIILVQENVSFDHYFGTYHNAANIKNGTKFMHNNDISSINGKSIPIK